MALGGAALAGAQARAPLEVEAEPHHHLILENALVRVFAVGIPVHQDAYVLYRHNYLTVTLQESRLAMWSEGVSAAPVYPINAGDTRFFIGGMPIGIRNEGRTKYRNITVEFLDPQVTTTDTTTTSRAPARDGPTAPARRLRRLILARVLSIRSTSRKLCFATCGFCQDSDSLRRNNRGKNW